MEILAIIMMRTMTSIKWNAVFIMMTIVMIRLIIRVRRSTGDDDEEDVVVSFVIR